MHNFHVIRKYTFKVQYCDFYNSYQPLKIGQDFVVQNLDYLNSGCNFGMRTYFLENHFVIDGTGESCCTREEGGVSS